MKILFAVKSSMKMWMEGAHKEIRKTWGFHIPPSEDASLKFFFGNGAGWLLGPDLDEIHVDAPDSYEGLSLKVKEILKWSIKEGYDYTYLCDTDTFCLPHRLIQVLLNSLSFDYGGWITPWEPFFAFGGVGYVVSKKFAQIIVDSPVMDSLDDVSIGKLAQNTPGLITLNAVKGWLRGVAWHFPKSVYACKSYEPRFPWMKLMAQQHLALPKINFSWTISLGGAIQTVPIQLSSEDRIDEFQDLHLLLVLPTKNSYGWLKR
jgi:hypothetical protein